MNKQNQELTIGEATILTIALRTAYNEAATSGATGTASAFASARDAIDSGILPSEICAAILLGKTTLEVALRDAAEVMRDTAADPDYADERAEAMDVIDDLCRAADSVRDALV